MTIQGTSEHAGDRIRLGMVGGGEGAFIGAVHRIAARLDDQYTLVAGAFSSDALRSRRSGQNLGVADDRIYASFAEMAAREPQRPDGIEAVAIVTPNHLHFAAAKAFLEAGVHVICDKPLTTSLEDAHTLVAIARRTNRVFAVTYYAPGYPLVRQGRAMVQEGLLGEIRVVQVEYAQDWLTEPLEETGHKQALWRTDPAQSGAGGTIGDIGTHAYDLACFVTGLEAESIAAELTTSVPGRRLDDNAHVLMRFSGGARGMLWASQVAPGNENGLALRVYGSRGGLEWHQEDPNKLWFTPYGAPKQLITRNGVGTVPAAARISRIPAGHPEGYLECFANIYSEVARAIRAHREGREPDPDTQFPSVEDGWRGVAFIEGCIASSRNGGAWTPLARLTPGA